MIIAIETVIAQRIEISVIESCPVRAGGYLNPCSIGEVVCAASDNDATRLHVQSAFVHLVPRGRILNGFGIADFNDNRNRHVPNRANSYCSGCEGEETVNSFLCPTVAEVAHGALILQIELMVITEQLVLESSYHCGFTS